MFNGSITHDQVTRFLSEKDYTNKDLWRQVKPIIREIEKENGCFIVDDCVTEKQFTDENDVIAWHFDHSVGRSVKGINTVNCAYTNGEQTVPLSFEIIKKTEKYIDKDGKEKRRSIKTKNALFLEMLSQAIHNKVKFKFVLADIWFGSVENMEYINKKKKVFILPLKSNRLVALSKKEKLNGGLSIFLCKRLFHTC
jgi:SRSO17 transposase